MKFWNMLRIQQWNFQGSTCDNSKRNDPEEEKTREKEVDDKWNSQLNEGEITYKAEKCHQVCKAKQNRNECKLAKEKWLIRKCVEIKKKKMNDMNASGMYRKDQRNKKTESKIFTLMYKI